MKFYEKVWAILSWMLAALAAVFILAVGVIILFFVVCFLYGALGLGG